MENTNYRILKLKSGEELITKIVGQKQNKMILERPMIFKSLMYQDEFGRKKELTVLKNWLTHSTQNTTEIPKDHIAIFLEPESMVVQLYDLEKEKEDTGEELKRKITGTPQMGQPPQLPFPFPPPQNEEMGGSSDQIKPEDMMSFLDAMNDMLDEARDNIEDLQEEIENEEITDPPDQDFVAMTILFPPKLIEELIERGIIDPKDMLDTLNMFKDDTPPTNKKNPPNMGRTFTDKDTSKEKDRPDFGTKWTDWSSDISDWLSD